MKSLLVCLLFVISINATSARASLVPSRTSVSDGSRSIRLIGEPGYQFVVAGMGWNAVSPVTVVVQSGAAAVLVLRPYPRGVFRVGVNGLDRCTGYTVKLRDSRHHHLQLTGPQFMCPARSDSPAPALTLLQGRGASAR